MRKYHDYFEPSSLYHIYNRAIGSENLFRQERNYTFFIEKWQKYIIPYADIWAYCLMPNHYHFLIEIKDDQYFPKPIGINEFLENQFKRLFSSYTLSFNKIYNRSGSLFQKSFKRIKVDSENYLLTLIHYIHHNPVHHNFVNDYLDWKFLSYSAIAGDGVTKVRRKEVLRLFGGREAFIEFHNQIKNYKKINHLIIE